MNAKSSNSKLQLFRVITHLVIDISPKYNLHGRLLTSLKVFRIQTDGYSAWTWYAIIIIMINCKGVSKIPV